MYRLVALDLDGTLIGPDGLICDEHRTALEAVQRAGLEVVLVTARTWAETEPIVRDLSLGSQAICVTGAAVYGISGAPVQSRLLSVASLERLARWAEAEGWAIRFYHPSGMEVQSHPAGDYVNRIGAWFAEPHRYVSDLPGYVRTNGDVLQAVLLGSRSVEAACARLGELPDVASTLYDRMTAQSRLHLFQHGVSKGAALADYCRQRNIPSESVIAMGDTSADKSMIDWAGAGVAMGWAPEHVRATANLVTSANDPAPVATALRELLALV